jgi:hypothetical protein
MKKGRKMMKKSVWLSVIAGTAAVVGAAVAVTAYLKKKSRALSDHLDYDPDEDGFDEDCCGCAECAEETDVEEEIPLYPEPKDELVAEESLDDTPETGSEPL